MRHLGDDRDVVVDPHAPGRDLTAGPLGAERVGGPGRGGQSEGDIVGKGNALVVGVEGQHHEHGAEELLLVGGAPRFHAGENRWGIEGPFSFRGLAAQYAPGPFPDAHQHLAVEIVPQILPGLRSDVRLLVERIARPPPKWHLAISRRRILKSRQGVQLRIARRKPRLSNPTRLSASVDG